MEAEATIEQRENMATLNANRADEAGGYAQNANQSDKSSSTNVSLLVILLMLAIVSDLIGIIPFIGQFVSLPVAAILRLIRRFSHYPNVVDAKPVPNVAYVLLTFRRGKLSDKLTEKLRKIKIPK